MNKKLVLLLVLLTSLMLAACGGADTSDATAELESRIADLEGQLTEAEAAADEAKAMLEEAGSSDGEAMASEDTLAAVRDRGTLKCGGNANLVGFGFLNPDTNEFAGFDVDFCKAIAAAVLGDSEAIEITATTGETRFPTLQSGEVDVLIRNTTWTISRDTSLGFEFGPVTFYDGQGMMVRADSGITTLEDLEGGSVCVQSGTTTEKNLADVFRALDIEIESQVYPDNPATTAAYTEGLCDGMTTDKSGLASIRQSAENPDDHVILDVTMSKEPLGPLVRHGDNNWGDVMRWVTNCTIQAEESGVTSANVDDMRGSDDPGILGLLGVEGNLGEAMGLDADFCYQVISQVGNYGEIYERHITPLGLERGPNAQWTDGGLLYAPPFR